MSYLNTRPMLYGMEQGLQHHPHRLQLDYPSNLVNDLNDGRIDIGLVPVAGLLGLKEYAVISDYCIGTEGEVASVCLFSRVPLHEVKAVRLDYQSRTSVMLCKLILRDHFKLNCTFMASTTDEELLSVAGTEAALLIGDRALMARSQFPYVTDLGTAWVQMTGLPFVFAVWVTTQTLSDSFLVDFNKAVAEGVEHLDAVIQDIHFQAYDLNRYFKENISYRLDQGKRKAIDLFLTRASSI